MSITSLSAARVAGELGLAGGTITGGCCAAHYGKQIRETREVLNKANKDIDEYKAHKRSVVSTDKEVMNEIMQTKTEWNALEDCMQDTFKAWNKCSIQQQQVNEKFKKLEELRAKMNEHNNS